MKKVFYLCALSFLACLQAYAQVTYEADIPVFPDTIPIPKVSLPAKTSLNQIYTVAQKMPSYPHGKVKLRRYIDRNFRYPPKARRENLEGTVIIKFVVTKTGDITNPEILKGMSSCSECNAEALRLVQMMPKWKPALQNETPVDCYTTLPITFDLRKKWFRSKR